ncbi:hypothetical protein BDF20DRAFT_872510 [Mycotypha africana]|uniref:uncharacterized protein n=1 Tax=Mycotypha africana TaxID=64632 RepID=UPI002300FD42|nr:uncharacterized protein BDF20DRAFT_872510 [Mycotypha africana]KAI8977031.1 hypothetical protein BDF20DRAFT_872510 [Mycotypha africana]
MHLQFKLHRILLFFILFLLLSHIVIAHSNKFKKRKDKEFDKDEDEDKDDEDEDDDDDDDDDNGEEENEKDEINRDNIEDGTRTRAAFSLASSSPTYTFLNSQHSSLPFSSFPNGNNQNKEGEEEAEQEAVYEEEMETDHTTTATQQQQDFYDTKDLFKSPPRVTDINKHIQVKLYCEVNEALCKNVEHSLISAATALAEVIRLKKKIIFQTSYYSFCEKICANSTYGWGIPSSQFTLISLNEADSNFIYPQALAKQLAQFTDSSNWAGYDVIIDINHDMYMSHVNADSVDSQNHSHHAHASTPAHDSHSVIPVKGGFWFNSTSSSSANNTSHRTSNTTLAIEPYQVDLEYVILHHMIHGLGMISSWAPYFSDINSPFQKLLRGLVNENNLKMMTPNPYWYIKQNTGPAYVTGFQPNMIFDKFLHLFIPAQNETTRLFDYGFDMQTFCVGKRNQQQQVISSKKGGSSSSSNSGSGNGNGGAGSGAGGGQSGSGSSHENGGSGSSSSSSTGSGSGSGSSPIKYPNDNDAFIVNFVDSFLTNATQSSRAKSIYESMLQPNTLSFKFMTTTNESTFFTNTYLNQTYHTMRLMTGPSIFNSNHDEESYYRPGIVTSHVDDMYRDTPDFLMTHQFIKGKTLLQIVEDVYSNLGQPIKYNTTQMVHVNVTTVSNVTTTTLSNRTATTTTANTTTLVKRRPQLVEVVYKSPIGPGILRILETMGYSTILTDTNYTSTAIKTTKPDSACDNRGANKNSDNSHSDGGSNISSFLSSRSGATLTSDGSSHSSSSSLLYLMQLQQWVLYQYLIYLLVTLLLL